ncbi:MAG: biotin/lipoyl-binding protein [Cryobacterium sp.]|nr:biotin/lipoyl-binding protein [Oligoflexia bacterium]
MSALKGEVGSKKIRWLKPPVGAAGSGEVEVDGKRMAVAWKRDADGLWIEFEGKTLGFDLFGEMDDPAAGLQFRISERGGDRSYSGLRFRGAGEALAGAGANGVKKSTRVRAQMPGKIMRILVKTGDEVLKDQPLLVMEAMKMENEIRALSSGKIEAVKITEGQAVESGADLMLIV